MQQPVLQTTFPVKIHPRPAVPRSRLLLLFLIFFFICCGLGYPILNRIDWRQAPGDSRTFSPTLIWSLRLRRQI